MCGQPPSCQRPDSRQGAAAALGGEYKPAAVLHRVLRQAALNAHCGLQSRCAGVTPGRPSRDQSSPLLWRSVRADRGRAAGDHLRRGRGGRRRVSSPGSARSVGTGKTPAQRAAAARPRKRSGSGGRTGGRNGSARASPRTPRRTHLRSYARRRAARRCGGGGGCGRLWRRRGGLQHRAER